MCIRDSIVAVAHQLQEEELATRVTRVEGERVGRAEKAEDPS